MKSRFEILMEALIEGKTTDINPQSKAEVILLRCIDQTGIEGLPAPTSRLEAYLLALAEKLEGGGGSEAPDEPSMTYVFHENFSGDTLLEEGDYPNYLLFDTAFECDGVRYEAMAFHNDIEEGDSIYYLTPEEYEEETHYGYGECCAGSWMSTNAWTNDKYRTITLLEEPSEEFAAFLAKYTGEQVYSLENYFRNGSIEEVILPNITTIKPYAFYMNGTIVTVTMPNVTDIGNYAFYKCSNLALTSLPEGLTAIGDIAFSDCRQLALTSLPEGLTSIGNQAFDGCTKMALTSLPEGLTAIGSGAFDSCTKMALTSLPEGLTSIGVGTFNNCVNLALTSLPKGLTSIGFNAFYGCSKLAELTFEGTPNSIATSAFSYCTNLTTINVPWGQGEVSGAPWGATNATINYNYLEANAVKQEG